jgi:hypothetical protein
VTLEEPSALALESLEEVKKSRRDADSAALGQAQDSQACDEERLITTAPCYSNCKRLLTCSKPARPAFATKCADARCLYICKCVCVSRCSMWCQSMCFDVCATAPFDARRMRCQAMRCDVCAARRSKPCEGSEEGSIREPAIADSRLYTYTKRKSPAICPLFLSNQLLVRDIHLFICDSGPHGQTESGGRVLAVNAGALVPRGGVTRQGVVLTDLRHL